MQEHSPIPLDIFIEITVSDDRLFAYLQFVKVPEQIAITMEQLSTLLKTNGVEHGIDFVRLMEIVNNPASFYHARTVVAIGEKPVQGENGYIEFLFDVKGGQKKPLELEDGKVDFKEVVSINNVRQGQLIASRVPARKGVPGKAVTGEALLPNPVKDVHFKIGKNVVLDQEKTSMYATIDGMVTMTENDKLNVFPIYEVNGDVDYSVGNISFVGSVVIRGNVLNGFKIKASGDIRITGGIEAAELEAGGSIVIGAGILGQNKGIVKADKTVKCSFVQEGTIYAGEDVVVMQSIMHSTIRAGRNVICQSWKGLIVGGIIQAGENVSARTIGNTVSTATVIEAGVLPELRNELQELRNKLAKTEDSLTKTDKALEMLDQLAVAGKLTPDKVAMRIKLNHTKKQVLDEIATMKERILEIEKIQEEIGKARIEAASTIYAGTKLVIGRNIKMIKNTIDKVYFQLSDGDIAMFSIVGR